MSGQGALDDTPGRFWDPQRIREGAEQRHHAREAARRGPGSELDALEREMDRAARDDAQRVKDETRVADRAAASEKRKADAVAALQTPDGRADFVRRMRNR